MTIIDFQLEAQDNCSSTALGTPEDARKSLEALLADRAWFMLVSLKTRPRCFGCGGRLLPKVVTVQLDFALCDACGTIDWSEYRPFWNALTSRGCTDELTRSRGIIFWTPPSTLPDQDAYLRWLELRDIMRRHAILHPSDLVSDL